MVWKQKIEYGVVLGLLMVVLFSKMATNSFHGDESCWIATSKFFEQWVQIDRASEAWQENVWTISDPALPKYLIAISWKISGFTSNQLNSPYNSFVSFEENEIQGNVPSSSLLLSARIPMVILCILSFFLIFIFFLKQFNRVIAYSWLFLVLINSTLIEMLLLATPEPPLLFFSITAFILTLVGQKHWAIFINNPAEKEELNKSWFFFTLSGFSIGLAAASKINAFIFCVSLFLLLIYMVFIIKGKLSVKERIKYFIRFFCSAILVAILVFIFLNPSLYPQPIHRMARMLKYRLEVMAGQAVRHNELTSFPMVYRWLIILKTIVKDYSPMNFSFGWVITSLMTAIGVIIIIIRNRSINRNVLKPEIVFLAFYFLMIFSSFMSPLLWDRYFLFPIFTMNFVMAITLGYLIDHLIKWINKGIHKIPSTNP